MVALIALDSSALQARRAAAENVISGDSVASAIVLLAGSVTETPDSAKGRLEYALSAIAVGEHLQARQRKTEALKFLLSAEQSLSGASFDPNDTHTHSQALYALAHVKAVHLHKYAEADDLLGEALKLEPDDAELKATKVRLESQYGVLIAAMRHQTQGGVK